MVLHEVVVVIEKCTLVHLAFALLLLRRKLRLCKLPFGAGSGAEVGVFELSDMRATLEDMRPAFGRVTSHLQTRTQHQIQTERMCRVQLLQLLLAERKWKRK